MQVHKLIVTVIDFDELGMQSVIDVLTNTRYSNDCIAPHVLSAETRDCGEWSDEHPLNNTKTEAAEIARLFADPAPVVMTDAALYKDLLNELGVQGHDGALAEIAKLRETAFPTVGGALGAQSPEQCGAPEEIPTACLYTTLTEADALADLNGTPRPENPTVPERMSFTRTPTMAIVADQLLSDGHHDLSDFVLSLPSDVDWEAQARRFAKALLDAVDGLAVPEAMKDAQKLVGDV